MPRHDFDDDDWDVPAPRPKGSNTTLVIVLVAGGALALGALVCGGLGLMWTRSVRMADDGAELVTDAEAAQAEVQRARVEAGAAPAADRERIRDAEDDRAQADYLARQAAIAKARDEGIPAQYRRLTPDQRAAVDEVRAAITKRPAVELTDRQRTTLKDRLDFFKHTDVLAYRLALADQNGGRDLARRLKLTHDPAIFFRLAYGNEPPDRRAQVRDAIELRLATGPRFLSDDDRKVLEPYKEHLRHLP